MRPLKASLLIFAAVALFGYQQSADPWRASELLQPAAVAAELKAKTGEQPLILQVGFQALYRGARLTGAKYAGPGSTAEGLANLESVVKNVSRNRTVLIYCGCCPWEHCPNIRPAYKKLHELGFKNIQVMHVATNLHTDWVEHGYPVEKGE
jgi:thiosulfate/3-mercaptopyruvate sulfurtransferase